MNDYQLNSQKSKELTVREKRVQQPVVSGPVKVKKKSEVKKFADVFISEDVSKVKEYIFMDVLVPAVKKAISDIITNGIDMILYGEAGRTRKPNGAADKVSYRRYYDERRDTPRSSVTRSTYDYDNITLATRGEAEAVLDQMQDIITDYRMVSVADLYDLVGVTGSYTDNKYGWTDIHTAEVIRVRDGYILKLPRALPID